MSISLNLVIYRTKDQELIEEGLKTVRCEDATNSLLEKICSQFPLTTRTVYFDESLSDSFDIECFSASDIDGVYKILKEMFLHLLQVENKNLNSEESKQIIQKCEPTIYEESILSNDTRLNSFELSVARFRIITGVIGMFADAKNMLGDNVGTVIKLG